VGWSAGIIGTVLVCALVVVRYLRRQPGNK
jgi:hypothetical protein